MYSTGFVKRKVRKIINKVPSETRWNFFFGVIIFGILFAFWLQTISIPYWWDAVGMVIEPSRDFLKKGIDSFFISGGDRPRSFLVPVFLGLFWKMFGETILVSRVFNLLFSFLALFYTYLLAAEMTEDKNAGRWTGIFASLLLLFTPVFQAQVGITLLEIPLMAFAVAAFYYFFKRDYGGYLFFSSLGLLTKETFVFLILSISAYIIWKKAVRPLISGGFDFQDFAKELLACVSPLVVIFWWFLIYSLKTGQFFLNLESLSFSIPQMKFVFKFLLFDQGRIIVSAFFLLALNGVFYQKRYKNYFQKRKILLLAAIVVVMGVGVSFTGFMHRNILVILPFFYLLSLQSLRFFVHERPFAEQFSLVGAGAILAILIFTSSWNNHREIRNWQFIPLEDNLEYRDVIRAGEMTADYIEKQYPQSTIWTSFPTTYMLSDPFYGYVSTRFEVKNCFDFEEEDEVNLLVFHLFSPGQQKCGELVNEEGLTLLTSFSSNGKWMQIYKKPDYKP